MTIWVEVPVKGQYALTQDGQRLLPVLAVMQIRLVAQGQGN